MARHTLADPDVRTVADAVAVLFLREGSAQRVQRLLTARLAADRSEGWIYPNRLHTLLSEDLTRAVNTDTLETLTLALSRLGPDALDPERALAAAATTITRVLRGWLALTAGAIPEDHAAVLRTLGRQLGLPAGVVRWIVHRKGRLAGTTITATRPGGDPERVPDWSFQDEAHAACLHAFAKDPNRKVGLILPTGAGKTRVALRIVLSYLAQERDDAVVVWVTHRTRLSTQAHRELQRAITAGTPDVPSNAVELLADRVEIVMMGDLAERLDELRERVALVVVDEAHHAAAPSYQPIFDRRPLRGLFLTATPNRTDLLPIGIDEIAYTITYRELFSRGVIVEPQFEDPLVIDDFDWWDDADVRDLADYVLERAEAEFVKTLVVTSRTDHVERMYRVLVDELDSRSAHVLRPDDIGFVHGGKSSTGALPEEFLDEFIALPRGILVATSQMLGEGFDDPNINAVVVTYRTTSLIQLMQAAGRALRAAPGKTDAYIVQLKDSELAYHYEQRWLYQDISDVLRPQLVDVGYGTQADLVEHVGRALASYNVAPDIAARIMERTAGLEAGTPYSLLLTGLPYDGDPASFSTTARWNALLIDAQERELFLRVFNDFSARRADVNDPVGFLQNYLEPRPGRGSRWQSYIDMLWAMDYARRELLGDSYSGHEGRGYAANQGSTWLTYVTFQHRPGVPAELEAFLSDAFNRDEVLRSFAESPDGWTLATKVPLPLTGTWAFLLDRSQAEWLISQRADILTVLADVAPDAMFAAMVGWKLALPTSPVPALVVERFETFLTDDRYVVYTCPLGPLDASEEDAIADGPIPGLTP